MKLTTLARIAEKIKREEVYHLRHSQTWVRRLGLGTEESNMRIQNALDAIWPYVMQMIHPVYSDSLLVAHRYVPNPYEIWEEWRGKVIPFLENSGLVIPDLELEKIDRGKHPKEMEDLIDELQEVTKQFPDETW